MEVGTDAGDSSTRVLSLTQLAQQLAPSDEGSPGSLKKPTRGGRVRAMVSGVKEYAWGPSPAKDAHADPAAFEDRSVRPQPPAPLSRCCSHAPTLYSASLGWTCAASLAPARAGCSV